MGKLKDKLNAAVTAVTSGVTNAVSQVQNVVANTAAKVDATKVVQAVKQTAGKVTNEVKDVGKVVSGGASKVVDKAKEAVNKGVSAVKDVVQKDKKPTIVGGSPVDKAVIAMNAQKAPMSSSIVGVSPPSVTTPIVSSQAKDIVPLEETGVMPMLKKYWYIVVGVVLFLLMRKKR